jgi:hypothetical protein
MPSSITDLIEHMRVCQIITERKEKEVKEINTSRNKDIKALFFLRTTKCTSEVALQISLHKLERVTSKYKLKI